MVETTIDERSRGRGHDDDRGGGKRREETSSGDETERDRSDRRTTTRESSSSARRREKHEDHHDERNGKRRRRDDRRHRRRRCRRRRRHHRREGKSSRKRSDDDDDDDDDDDRSDASSFSSSASSSSSSGSSYRRRKRSKKRRRDDDRKEKRRRRGGDDSEDDERRHRHRRRRRKRSHDEDGESDGDGDGDDEDDDRYERKRTRKSGRERDRKRLREATTPATSEPTSLNTLPERLLGALHELLFSYPDMSSQLLWMLTKMSGSGTDFDLSSMVDRRAAAALRRVFVVLAPYGVLRVGNGDDDDKWSWRRPDGGDTRGGKRWDERLLVRTVRSLLNQAGFTMEAVENFERTTATNDADDDVDKTTTADQALRNDDGVGDAKTNNNELAGFAMLLVREFDSENKMNGDNGDGSTAASTNGGSGGGDGGGGLALEITDLCRVLLEGETLSLDGIPNAELRTGLQILFERAGLDRFEMEDEEDEDEGRTENGEDKDEKGDAPASADDAPKEPLMGYGLPEDDDEQGDRARRERAARNLADVARACAAPDAHRRRRRVLGPARPTADELDDDDDDDGPAPAGTAAARERARRVGPARPRGSTNDAVVATQNNDGAREEWMLTPGEHDFLEGVVRSGGATKSRRFRNERGDRGDGDNGGGGGVVLSERLQKQMDDTVKSYNEARGPSLVELHRERLAEEKEERLKRSGGKPEWKWNRESDLDAGRRVDKNHLKQVLGGAAKGLTDKFQGGLSRSFT